MQVTQVGLVFFDNTFFFKVANKAVQRLTAAGIMYWMIENEIKPKRTPTIQKEPKQLTLDCLSFGFEIWIGFCGLSAAVFFGEISWKYLKVIFLEKTHKIAESKTHAEKIKIKRKTRRMRRKLYKKLYNHKFIKAKLIRKTKKVNKRRSMYFQKNIDVLSKKKSRNRKHLCAQLAFNFCF
ncbi:hypothetical protein ACKWTF_016514 [Chironomus riparius]